MVVNQLFIAKPTQDLILKIINTFGIKDLKDSHEFSLLDMNNIETVKKLKESGYNTIEIEPDIMDKNSIENDSVIQDIYQLIND